MREEILLEMTDLIAGYGDIKILMGLSIAVRPGEVLAVVGPNGAGKSTLLKCITGLGSISHGKIRFMEREISNCAYTEIARLGITLCAEGGKVFSEMSIKDNLLIGGYLRTKDERKEQLEFVYDLFPKLKERNKQLAGTLSGGERQMVALGRALMSKPALLMLDEPSFGLDPLAKKAIYGAIRHINQKEGIPVLLVEQDAALALEFAGRAYAIENGKVAMHGKPEQFMSDESFRKLYLGL